MERCVARGMNSTEIAHHWFMCEKSVHRYLTLFHSTASVAPKEHRSGPLSELTMLQTLIYCPTSYLYEVQYVAVTGRKRTLGPNYSATSMTCNS